MSLHMREHFPAACLEKSDDEIECYHEKDNVQSGRVIKRDRCFNNLGIALIRNQSESLKNEFDDQCRPRHRNIEDAENECRCFPAIVLPVDVEDRENN